MLSTGDGATVDTRRVGRYHLDPMKRAVGLVDRLSGWVGCALVGALLGAGCAPTQPSGPGVKSERAPYKGSRILSFTDTYSVTAVVDGGPALWAASNQGLLRWDVAKSTYGAFTQKDGIPPGRILGVTTDREGAVWVATAKGVARGTRTGWKSYPPAPVGEFIIGLAASVDRDEIWAAGPQGVARLRNGTWNRFFVETPVTAISMAPNGALWLGTTGRGVLRVLRTGDTVEQYGVSEGCEPDVIRAIVAGNDWVLVVGENAKGARAAVFDGSRFWSYGIDQVGPASIGTAIEWAARGGNDIYAGKDQTFYRITLNQFPADAHEGKLRFVPLPTRVVGARMAPLSDNISSRVFDTLERTAPPPVAPRPANGQQQPGPPTGPVLFALQENQKLPEGVLGVQSGDRGALVGTRFRGIVRIEGGLLRHFQTEDLTAGADRITVACTKGDTDDCFLATGGVHAWRFDGQSFAVAAVDPEPGSRVLAMVRDASGAVMAIHRGAKDSLLRISRVDDGRWTPVGMQGVSVPSGAPDLNFAAFAPTGNLWVGLRYTDSEKDVVDFGAAEMNLSSGVVKYHRLDPALPPSQQLPNNVVALAWRADDEPWFATRSGAARLLDGKLTVFTENDGMESEIIHDIGVGPNGQIWAATGRGTGHYDGARWHFDKLGGFYLPANAIARDDVGHTFLGTEKGVICYGACSDDIIDSKRGLVDDAVIDLAVDDKRRVWVLTKKGVSIVEP